MPSKDLMICKNGLYDSYMEVSLLNIMGLLYRHIDVVSKDFIFNSQIKKHVRDW